MRSFAMKVIVLAMLTACGADPARDSSTQLVELSISTERHEDFTLSVGMKQQVFATAKYENDTRKDVTNDPATTWTSSSPSIASVDGTGLVTALSQGVAILGASYKGETASETLTITP